MVEPLDVAAMPDADADPRRVEDRDEPFFVACRLKSSRSVPCILCFAELKTFLLCVKTFAHTFPCLA